MASISYLPFLRPLFSPRFPFLLNNYRQASTAPCLRRKATTDVPPLVQKPPQTLQYHVHRTASQKLPVYLLDKRGGNLHQTKIRKISGNIAQLKDDIQQALGLTDEHIVINQLTRHIIIKGRMKAVVEGFLEKLRF